MIALNVGLSLRMVLAMKPISEGEVLRALSRVHDPELDTPITELGIVDKIVVSDDGSVEVAIVMPTYWCSPNFTYIILEDVKLALSRLKGVSRVRVVLKGHHEAERISRCINEGLKFDECFPDEAKGSVEALRSKFKEKALRARLYALIKVLLRRGFRLSEIAQLELDDVAVVESGSRVVINLKGRSVILSGVDAKIAVRYLDILRELGLDSGRLVKTSVEGYTPTAEELERLMSAMRSTATNLSFNAELCKLLLLSRVSRRESS